MSKDKTNVAPPSSRSPSPFSGFPPPDKVEEQTPPSSPKENRLPLAEKEGSDDPALVEEPREANAANEPIRGGAEIERLREMVLGKREHKVDEVFLAFFDDDRRKTQLSNDLPDAFNLSAQAEDERFQDLVESVEKTVVASIETSVAHDRDRMSEALSPIMGAAIIKYLSSFQRHLNEVIDEKIDIATSPKRLRWWLEARSQGIEYREYVQRETGAYEVDEACLIHLDDFRILQKASVFSDIDQMSLDPNEPSEACRQVQQFLRETREADLPLQFTDHLTVGSKKAVVIHGATTSLAAIVTGYPAPQLEKELQPRADEMDQICGRAGGDLKLENDELAPLLQQCLISQKGSRRSGSPRGSRIVLTLVTLLALAAIGYWGFAKWRWAKFSRLVRETPGIELINVSRGWGADRITGLHDPLQVKANPEALLRKAGIDPEGVDSVFTAFHSLEEPFATQRKADEERRFQEVIALANSSRDEREDYLEDRLSETRQSELETFESEILERIGLRSIALLRTRLDLPEDLKMSVEDQVLKPVGRLEEPLYSRFLDEAGDLTLIDRVDTSELRNQTMEQIQESKSHAESFRMVFGAGSAEPLPVTEPRLREVALAILDMIEKGEQMGGLRPKLQLHAIPLYGESYQPDRGIDRTRLRKVTAALVEFGVPATLFISPVLDSLPDDIPGPERRGIYVRINLE